MIEFTPLPGIALGPFTINAHGIFIFLGVITAYLLFNKLTTDKLLLNLKDRLLEIMVVSGLLGARLLYVLTNLSYYALNPLDAIKFWEGGVSLLGGVIFASVASYLYLKSKKIDFFQAADFFVIPVVAGMFVGRIGDLLTWDHPGTASSMPWAFVINGAAQHPAILYEMIGLLAILGILFFVSKRKIFEGKMVFVYLTLYGALRFVNDVFREEQLYFGLRQGQIIGALLVIGGIIALLLKGRTQRTEKRKISDKTH